VFASKLDVLYSCSRARDRESQPLLTDCFKHLLALQGVGQFIKKEALSQGAFRRWQTDLLDLSDFFQLIPYHLERIVNFLQLNVCPFYI
jgi:hypothetical protein